MISKELLSEVLGEQYYIRNNKVLKIWIESDTQFSEEVNLHKLAHKCKEWANSKEYILYSAKMFSDNEFAYSCFIPDSIIDGTKRWYSDTEPQCIFNACEWVLKQKEKRLKR